MSALELSDDALITLLRNMFEQQHVSFSSLFLVGYANWKVMYGAFLYALKKDAEAGKQASDHSPNLEGYIKFLAVTNASLSPRSDNYEWASRRIFHAFLATLLRIAHGRARKKPELWGPIAEIWVGLLPGAAKLREIIDRTKLWSDDETSEFRDIKTEKDGENYCLAHLAPEEVRFHERISAWREKDLPPDVIAQIRADEKLLFGE